MKASVVPLSLLVNLECKHSLDGNMYAVHLPTERNLTIRGKKTLVPNTL